MRPKRQFRQGMRETTGRGRLDMIVFAAILSLAATPGAFAQEPANPVDVPGQEVQGQIYAVVFGDDPMSGFVAINPNDGTWTKLGPSRDVGARVSPDGRGLVYREIPGDRSMRVLDVTGEKEPVVLLKEFGVPAGWSGDGRHVFASTFSAMEPSPESFESWKIRVDGAEREPLEIPETELVVDASRDGEWLLTSSARRSPDGRAAPALTRRALYVMHPDGTGERMVRPAASEEDEETVDVRFLRLSPEGRKVLLLEAVLAGNGPIPKAFRLVSLSTDGADRRILLEGTPEGLRRPGLGCWSPDGKFVAVMVSEGALVADGKLTLRNQRLRLEILDAEGKTIRQVPLPDAPPGGARNIIDWR